MLIGYKPIFYECESVELVEDSGTIFELDVPGIGNVSVKVDQHLDSITDTMKRIVERKHHSDTLYLTHGMRDIDVRYIMNNTWQLYDEINFYTFEMKGMTS